MNVRMQVDVTRFTHAHTEEAQQEEQQGREDEVLQSAEISSQKHRQQQMPHMPRRYRYRHSGSRHSRREAGNGMGEGQEVEEEGRKRQR